MKLLVASVQMPSGLSEVAANVVRNLGSHRRDRMLHEPTAVDREDLRGYVRRKLATWEEILDGPIG